mmetsp:Transcript_43745/g.111333  ORF Transcript_43745/g.111333 Transcript_43745/m.111333 type:complete len:150 (+) Transcript_43745:108-557(+)
MNDIRKDFVALSARKPQDIIAFQASEVACEVALASPRTQPHAAEIDDLARGGAPPTAVGGPEWSTLSAEDRLRFGLDEPASPPRRSCQERFGQPPPDKAAYKHHPEALWGPGASSMPRTLAQLEAVGVDVHLAKLEETERQLQLLKIVR